MAIMKNSKTHIIYTVLMTIIVVFSTNLLRADILQPISGRSVDIDSILPADVLARVQLLSDEIELLRLELGEPELQIEQTPVTGASPREVYFQAQASFIKANRLLYEQTGNRNVSPSLINVASIKPFHVWNMVNAAYEQVIQVKHTRQISEQVVEKEQSIDTLPSDVFAHTVVANSQLNNLLQRPFSSDDVYQKVNKSIHAMAALLATTSSVKRIPTHAEFERRKTPTQVYHYLLENRQLLLKIMKRYDVKFASLQHSDKASVKTIGEVYDFSALLVANVLYVHALKPTAKLPTKTYPVINKTPSDVYQRLSILHQQLLSLEQLHQTDADWLNH